MPPRQHLGGWAPGMGANGGGDEDDRRASNAKASVSSKDAGSVPVLPWMRLPVAFDAGSGVGLEAVSGMDPRLTAALRGEHARDGNGLDLATSARLPGTSSDARLTSRS